LCCRLVPALPRLKSACPLPFRIRGIPVRRPTLLPPASFRRASLLHPLEPPKPLAKELAFGYRCHSLWSLSPAARLSASLRVASVGLGLDFARYLCHKYRPSPFSSRALPGTQQTHQADAKNSRGLWVALGEGQILVVHYEQAQTKTHSCRKG